MGKHAQTTDERILNARTILLSEVEQQGMFIVNENVPTQVANPVRTSWRTFVQSAIGGLVALNALLGVLAGFLVANSESAAVILGKYYGPVIAVVNAGVAVGALLSKFIAQGMANPQVNAWVLEHLPWLAPIAPKSIE